LTELLIAGIAAVVLVTARKTPRWGAFDWIAFGYVAANAVLVWVNVVRQGDAFTAEIQGTLLGPLQFFLLYRTILTAVGDANQRATALRLLLVASVPVSILTLFQQWNVGPTRDFLATLTGPIAAEHYAATLDDIARATGPFPHWHNLGGYLLLVLLLGVSILREPGQRVMRGSWLVATLVPAFLALVQTASIAPLVGLLVGSILIITSVGRTRRTLVVLGAILVLATAASWSAFSNRLHEQFRSTTNTTEGQTLLPRTIAFRVEVWQTQFVPVIQDNLLLGYGPTLPPKIRFDYAESLYITFLLRGGVVLVLFYLALMGALLLRSRRITRSDEPERRAVARAVFAAVILLLAIDTIASYFLDSGPAPLLWTLAALMGYQVTRTRAGSEPTSAASS
jgi:hypothetical protein